MAQLYAEIQGNCGLASRVKTGASSIWVHIRGRNVGCRVYVEHRNGKDVVTVYRSGGSNARVGDVSIAQFTED